MRETRVAAPLQPWLTVATYNIHDAIGADGEFAPERIAAVIAELNADVIALQEIGSHVAGTDDRKEGVRRAVEPAATEIEADGGRHFLHERALALQRITPTQKSKMASAGQRFHTPFMGLVEVVPLRHSPFRCRL